MFVSDGCANNMFCQEKNVGLSITEKQVERACDWTLQRAAKNTLREALRYVTAEQEAAVVPSFFAFQVSTRKT